MNSQKSVGTGKHLPRAIRVIPSLLLALVILIGWQIYAETGNLGPDILPSPTRVASQGWQHRDDLWENTLPTIQATMLGFGLSILIGFILSVIIDRSALLRRAVLPLLVVSQTLPLIAIAPLFILWFGFTLLPKVLIVVLVTFFPITVNLVEGYSTADPDSEKLLRSMGAGYWQVLRMVRIPTSMPFFFSGLRIGITYAVVAAIFAEYAGAEKGLGIYMQGAKNSFRTDLVLAAVVVSSALTLALFALTYLIERLVAPWVYLSKKEQLDD